MVPLPGILAIGAFLIACAWLVWHGRRVRLRGSTDAEREAARGVGNIYVAFGVAMAVALVVILLVAAWLTRVP